MTAETIRLTSLLNQLTKQLHSLSFQLVTAESCTGGLLANYLNQLPGSSAWFDRGFITYSNASKIELLDVAPQLILKNGAVSTEVASAMAEGSLCHSQADIAISITGIAGPSGGTQKKPVGTVCFAWGMRDNITHTEHCYFNLQSREEIRQAAALHALAVLSEMLKHFMNSNHWEDCFPPTYIQKD